MLQMNNTSKITTIALFVFLAATVGIFIFVVGTSVIRPFFFAGPGKATSVTLDTSFDDIVDYLRQREDLTVASPSATLTKEPNSALIAQIINSSGVEGAAKTLADALEPLGITVTQLGNSTPSGTTIVALKSKALSYKDTIVEKIGTKSAAVRFEDLDDTDAFDIRITLGR